MGYTVHPVAALFPMMSDEELAELAEDIKTNGLLDPIKVDNDGQIIDGRNRLAACELAGVEPVFETYEGDADVYALSANINRRMLTKGQRAMITVMAKPPRAASGNRVLPGERAALAESSGVSTDTIGYARLVQTEAPDLVPEVVVGTRQLKTAWEEARARKQARDARAAKIANLKGDYPDLAAAVESNDMDLEAAEREARERRAVDASIRSAVTRAVTEREVMEQNAGTTVNPDVIKSLREYVKQTKRHAANIERMIANEQ